MKHSKNQNKIMGNKSYKFKNVKFNKIKKVHIGDKIHQEINDNTVYYETNISDVKNIETFSKYITSHFSKTKITIAGLISLLAGLFSMFTGLNSYTSDTFVILKRVALSKGFGVPLIFIGLGLIVIGFILIYALQYKKYTKCKNKKCEKEYAYKPSKNPIVREVDSSDKIRRTTTHFYKCRYCGHKYKSKYNQSIPYKQN